eukprot:4419529-Prymnesium_polylepis.2
MLLAGASRRTAHTHSGQRERSARIHLTYRPTPRCGSGVADRPAGLGCHEPGGCWSYVLLHDAGSQSGSSESIGAKPAT